MLMLTLMPTNPSYLQEMEIPDSSILDRALLLTLRTVSNQPTNERTDYPDRLLTISCQSIYLPVYLHTYQGSSEIFPVLMAAIVKAIDQVIDIPPPPLPPPLPLPSPIVLTPMTYPSPPPHRSSSSLQPSVTMIHRPGE